MVTERIPAAKNVSWRRFEDQFSRLAFKTCMKTYKSLPTRRSEDVFSINAPGIQVVLNIIIVGSLERPYMG